MSDSEPKLIPSMLDHEKVRMILISEALPEDMDDYFFSKSKSLFVVNTIEAFNVAGVPVKSIDDILMRGVYLTVAVKEPRRGLTVPPDTIEKYSHQLEKEIGQFPHVKAILLMGDTAIKAMNLISKRTMGKRAIPPGSTYRIRGEKYSYNGIRIFPSYLQTGKNFLIEKSKRTMVAEDIRSAFALIEADQ